MPRGGAGRGSRLLPGGARALRDAGVAEPPLAATLTRTAALHEWLGAGVGAPDEAGWISAGELPEHLSDLLDLVAQVFETENRRVGAALFTHYYAARIAGPAVAAYLAEGRVPDLRPEHVLFRFDPGGDVGLCFATPGFAGLVGDGEAADCREEAEDLRRHLATSLEAHFATNVPALRAATPLGFRAIWALAADACATVFLWAGQLLGDPDRGRVEGEAFLAAGTHLRSRAGYLELDHKGRREIVLRRGSCCLAYQREGHEYCANCPLVPEEETVRRMREEFEAAATDR